MVKIEEMLEHGETVIKKNRWRTEYRFGAQGTLWLTNRRLIFTSSRWTKGYEGKLSPEHPDAVPIPLGNIRNVEIRRMNTLKILTDNNKKYEFKHVEKDFLAAIEQATRMMEQPSKTPRGVFCPSCGIPAKPGDGFCAHCGTKLNH